MAYEYYKCILRMPFAPHTAKHSTRYSSHSAHNSCNRIAIKSVRIYLKQQLIIYYNLLPDRWGNKAIFQSYGLHCISEQLHQAEMERYMVCDVVGGSIGPAGLSNRLANVRIFACCQGSLRCLLDLELSLWEPNNNYTVTTIERLLCVCGL